MRRLDRHSFLERGEAITVATGIAVGCLDLGIPIEVIR
jgi:hypothetical protein